MKKLIKNLWFVLLLAVFASCKTTCVIAQLPPQIIYAGAGCTAVIPDYKPYANVNGGCTGFTLTQTPAQGTALTVNNKTATVILKATGANGKSSQVQFNVTMADTITPRFASFTGPLAINTDSLKSKVRALGMVMDSMAYRAGMWTYDYTPYPGLKEFIDRSVLENSPFKRMTILKTGTYNR
jgi:hypothetical protein